jgi:hypothetical protein
MVSRGPLVSNFLRTDINEGRAAVYHCQDGRRYSKYKKEKSGEILVLFGSAEKLEINPKKIKNRWTIVEIYMSKTKDECNFE